MSEQPIARPRRADDDLPPYPEGEVVGPCVCGSWPGGECLKCWVIDAPTTKDTGGEGNDV